MAITTQRIHRLTAIWRHRQRLADIRIKIKAVMKKMAAINKINMASHRKLKVLIGKITVNMTEQPDILRILECLSMILRLKNIPSKSGEYKKMIRYFKRMLVSLEIVDNKVNENNVLNYFRKNLKKIIEECDKQIGSCKIPICTEENICCNLQDIFHNIIKSINKLRVWE